MRYTRTAETSETAHFIRTHHATAGSSARLEAEAVARSVHDLLHFQPRVAAQEERCAGQRESAHAVAEVSQATRLGRGRGHTL